MNQPIYQLLGGQFHTRGVRAYASSIYWDLTPDQAADELAGWVERFYRRQAEGRPRAPRKDATTCAPCASASARTWKSWSTPTRAWAATTRWPCCAFSTRPAATGSRNPCPSTTSKATASCARRRYAGAHRHRREPHAQRLQRLHPQRRHRRAAGRRQPRRRHHRALAISASAASAHLAWNPHTFNDIITVAANLHLVAASPHRPCSSGTSPTTT